MHMNAALDKVNTFKELGELATQWEEAKGKTIYKTSTGLGAEIIKQEGTLAYSIWEQTKDPTQEQGYVKQVVKKIRDVVVSNLEVDVLGETKEQNEIVQQKQQAMKDPIGFIDNVVTAKVPINQVEPKFISMAVAEFLCYIK
jgi:hypothetical protein